MKKALILFTNYYPYYRGEEYLETELPIALGYYDKILVFPTMVSSNMKLTRKVPDGVEVFKKNIDCSLTGKIKMVAKYSFNKNRKRIENLADLKEENTLSKKLYNLYFQSRVAYVTDVLSKRDFSSADGYKITIYSYWMHAVASIAMNVREIFFRNNKDVLLICRGHRYDLYHYRNRLKYIPDRNLLLDTYSYIFPCSQDGVDYLNKKYPGHEQKIQLRRLGTIDNGVIEEGTQKPYIFVSCSSVTKVKRLNYIIDLIRELQKRNYSVKWIHFGAGAAMKDIEKYAARNLKKGTYDFRGHVSNQMLMDAYKKLKPFAFLNTSASEGVPVSIMEAQSFGIPVIATDVGGTGELIEDCYNGFLVSVDIKMDILIKKAILMMNLSKSNYEEMRKASRKKWEKMSSAYVVYNYFYNTLV